MPENIASLFYCADGVCADANTVQAIGDIIMVFSLNAATPPSFYG